MTAPLILSPEKVEECAAKLAGVLETPGSVVLVPTETVYGLVGKYGDKAAYRRIFELKQRSEEKVLGLFVPDAAALEKLHVQLEGYPEKLIRRFTPGPLTIIAPCSDGGTLGFRIPDHPLLLALLRLTGPLYQTSANLSGRPDPLDLDSALAELSGMPDAAVDGGPLPPGAKGSTVVKTTGTGIEVLRRGALEIDTEKLSGM